MMRIIFVLTLSFLPLIARIDAAQKLCPVVLGHRGAAGIYPEHTVIAYENGADLGADYIECDVQVTKVSLVKVLIILIHFILMVKQVPDSINFQMTTLAWSRQTIICQNRRKISSTSITS